jgi:hypothetical protein
VLSAHQGGGESLRPMPLEITPSLRHASATTAPARPRCRHFVRSRRTWPSSQVRTLMTLLSVSTLCSRRWCSSTMTPTARREPSRSSSAASLRSRSRSLDRVSTGPLHDVDQRGDRSPQGRRWRRTTASLEAYHRRREVTSHSGTRRAEAPRWGREDVPRVAPTVAPPATRSRHETTPATTVASLTIGSRSINSHDAAKPTSHR